jgi:zinc and cadmium transporter
MTPAQQSLIAVGVSSAIPLAGTLLFAAGITRFAGWLPHVIPFAVGAMTGAALFHLLPEALAAGRASPGAIAIAVLGGMLAFVVLERLTHRRSDELPDGAGPRAVLTLSIASDALHNLVDGVLVAATFLTDPALGVITAGAVALHELPRELGTFALCVAGGLSIRRALLVNAATAALALGGALAVISLGDAATQFAIRMLPVAAGAFLYLAGSIVWIDRRRLVSPSLRLQYSALVVLGLLIAGASRM